MSTLTWMEISCQNEVQISMWYFWHGNHNPIIMEEKCMAKMKRCLTALILISMLVGVTGCAAAPAKPEPEQEVAAAPEIPEPEQKAEVVDEQPYPSFVTAIEHKKNGLALTDAEIQQFVDGAANGSIPDYQLSAMLMAIRLKGMRYEETTKLTVAMRDSGETLSLKGINGVTLDKHSTGGVSDGTSLVIAPLVAACGGYVPMISGRGLGFTGGTLDKLESIEGMSVDLSTEEFVNQVGDIGLAIIGQTGDIAPADKKLYALRDVTSTVDSIPLIASSILSKKLVSGTEILVLDVKTGNGAVMTDLQDSVELAKTMVAICNGAGVKAMALVTDMNQPLGTYVGNSLEVEYAIRVLSGEEKGDFTELCLTLGSYMLVQGNLADDRDSARAMLQEALDSGKGLEKLREMITAQGGDPKVCDDLSHLPHAPVVKTVTFSEEGYVTKIDTAALGCASRDLGAGRLSAEDQLDYSVGFIFPARIGDKVDKDTVLCTIYAKNQKDADMAEKAIREAVTVEDSKPELPQIIYAVIDAEGNITTPYSTGIANPWESFDSME